MAKRTLADMTDDELEAENQRLMAGRAELEAKFKASQMAIAAELDARASSRRVDALLAGLTDDERAAIAARLEG